jgi:hypothetical protein
MHTTHTYQPTDYGRLACPLTGEATRHPSSAFPCVNAYMRAPHDPLTGCPITCILGHAARAVSGTLAGIVSNIMMLHNIEGSMISAGQKANDFIMLHGIVSEHDGAHSEGYSQGIDRKIEKEDRKVSKIMRATHKTARSQNRVCNTMKVQGKSGISPEAPHGIFVRQGIGNTMNTKTNKTVTKAPLMLNSEEEQSVLDMLRFRNGKGSQNMFLSDAEDDLLAKLEARSKQNNRGASWGDMVARANETL